jgi:ankyrin repeat protein
MKHLLLTTIAAVLVVGCGESQQSATSPETKPDEPVAEASQPEPPTAKAPDISIHEAANEGNIEAVKQHLAAGTDVNVNTNLGRTPLHCAANGGHKEIIELLIAEGADVNAKVEGAGTPLHYAARWGHKEVGKLLIAAGADVNAKNKYGSTPLHSADTKEIAELIIAAGADVNAKDWRGRTPLDLSIKFDETDIADLLRKHGGKTGEELRAAGN